MILGHGCPECWYSVRPWLLWPLAPQRPDLPILPLPFASAPQSSGCYGPCSRASIAHLPSCAPAARIGSGHRCRWCLRTPVPRFPSGGCSSGGHGQCSKRSIICAAAVRWLRRMPATILVTWLAGVDGFRMHRERMAHWPQNSG